MDYTYYNTCITELSSTKNEKSEEISTFLHCLQGFFQLYSDYICVKLGKRSLLQDRFHGFPSLAEHSKQQAVHDPSLCSICTSPTASPMQAHDKQLDAPPVFCYALISSIRKVWKDAHLILVDHNNYRCGGVLCMARIRRFHAFFACRRCPGQKEACLCFKYRT